MTKWNYRCDEVNLTHDQMLELNKDGSLELSIVRALEEQIDILTKSELTKDTSGYKFTTRHKVPLGIVAISVFFGIYYSWEWLVIGLIAIAVIIFDKPVNTGNIIDLAMKDANFFEKVKEIDGWIFLIEEDKEKEYLIHPNEEDDDEAENIEEDKEEDLDRDDDEEDEEDDLDEITQDTQLLGKWLDKRVNDYVTYMVDNHTSIDIVDSSELPHPKEEILDAIIASVILDQDGESIGALNAAALELAYHQENVGPKRLSLLGVSTSEFMEDAKSFIAKVNVDPEKIEKEGFSEEETDLVTKQILKIAPSKDGEKKYKEFEVLVHAETIIICEKLEEANKLRESSLSEKLKGISSLTNVLKYLKS